MISWSFTCTTYVRTYIFASISRETRSSLGNLFVRHYCKTALSYTFPRSLTSQASQPLLSRKPSCIRDTYDPSFVTETLRLFKIQLFTWYFILSCRLSFRKISVVRERISTARAVFLRHGNGWRWRGSHQRQSVGIGICSTKKRRVHRMEAPSGRKATEDTVNSTVATVLIYRRGFLVEAIPRVRRIPGTWMLYFQRIEHEVEVELRDQ